MTDLHKDEIDNITERYARRSKTIPGPCRAGRYFGTILVMTIPGIRMSGG